MPRTPPWRELIPGVTTIVVILLGSLAVMRYARIGALHGDTFSLVVLAGDAGDLAKGSEVWLAGQKVGLVDAISFRPPSSDSAYRLRLDLSILEAAHPLLRSDSRARIATGGTLLGASVLALSVGTPDGHTLRDGDTLFAQRRVAPSSLTGQIGELAGPASELRREVSALLDQSGAPGGMLDAVRAGGATVELGRLAAALRQLSSQLDGTDGSHEGTLTLARRDPRLRERSGRLRASADSVRALLAGESGTLGRFRRDSTLARSVAELRDEASILRALASSPEGTAGRLRADSTLATGLATVEAELAALVADMKRHPLRYISF